MPVQREARRSALAIYGGTAMAVTLAASSAPTPLYRTYQFAWHLSPTMLTLIFAAYAISQLVALLTVGSLSDHVGRRAVISMAMAMCAVAMLAFAMADTEGSLIVARILLGFAAGAATSTSGAIVVDSGRPSASLVNALAPFLGIGFGVILSGLLVAYGPAPTVTIYCVLGIAFATLSALIWQLPETASPKRGALRSLRPHLAVPPAARRVLWMVRPVNVANWALGGFYLSLMPTLFAQITGGITVIVVCLVIAVLPLGGAVAIVALRGVSAPKVLRIGSGALVVGAAILLAGIWWSSAGLLVMGTIFASVGFGAGFFGSTRTLFPLAELHERAGLISAFYCELYLALGIPVIGAAALSQWTSLRIAGLVYAALVMTLALISLLFTWRPDKRPAVATPMAFSS